MRLLETGVPATSRKENEARLPLYPRRLDRVPPLLRSRITLERGYGARFGVGDEALAALGYRLAARRELLAASELVILPKPLPADLREMKPGAILWGWPHCVQQREITQVAIDRRLTLLAWEAMFRWGARGERRLHTFYKNNELAGYCSVLHALQLAGWDGFYGPLRRAAVLGFGSVARGAIHALQGRGFTDVTVYTQRPPHLVRDQLFGCRFGRMLRGEADEGLIAEGPEEGRRPMAEALGRRDLIVNATLQDTDRPLMYLREGEEGRLRRGTMIVDVSCDEGMGFAFARPTSFQEPALLVGDGVVYYAVDHSPTYLFDSATWEISAALSPFLERVMSGPPAWESEPTLAHAVEIRDGVIRNPKVLSFQNRSPEYPHLVAAE